MLNVLVMKLVNNDPISAIAREFIHLAFLHNMCKQPTGNKEGEIAKYKSVTTKQNALNYIDDPRKKVKVVEKQL